MSKKYKRYLWENGSLPIRTFSRYRSDVLSDVNDVPDEITQTECVSSEESSYESDECEMPNKTSGESSLNSSFLSDKSESDGEEENLFEDNYSLTDDLEKFIEL